MWLCIFVLNRIVLNTMNTITYEWLKAEQAWMVVSDQLQQRNTMLGKSISHLERSPAEQEMASQLLTLRYHLKLSIRQLTREIKRPAAPVPNTERLHQQWRHTHQLFFLLRQIDTELNRATRRNNALRVWVNQNGSRVYRSALVYLN